MQAIFDRITTQVITREQGKFNPTQQAAADKQSRRRGEFPSGRSSFLKNTTGARRSHCDMVSFSHQINKAIIPCSAPLTCQDLPGEA